MPLTPLNLKPIILADTSAKNCFKLLAHSHISQIALKLPCAGGYLNFASLAFKVRVRGYGERPHLVDLASFDLAQANFVKEWACAIAERYYRGDPARTLYKEFRSARLAIEWAEQNGHPHFFDDCELYHKALIAYSYFLKSGVGTTRHNNSAHYDLEIAQSLSEIAFPDAENNLLIGVAHIPFDKSAIKHTVPPTTKELDSFIVPISELFIGIHTFLSTERRMPYSFQTANDTVWIVSGFQTIMSTTVLSGDFRRWGNAGWIWVKDKALLKMESSDRPFHTCVAEVMLELDRTRTIRLPYNNSFYPNGKITIPARASKKDTHKLCRIAHDCFVFMFALATAANAQPLQDIIWDKFSHTERGAQNQRVIKNRANKEVEIRFEARFAKEFECYLAVREILVENYSFDFLFGHFIYGEPPRKMPQEYLTDALQPVKTFISPKMPLMGIKKLRAYHLHYKRNKDGIQASAWAGNHTVRTSIESYATGHIDVNIDETTVFFTAVGMRAKEMIASSRATSSGECAGGIAGAAAIDDTTELKPNCQNFLGCLFCKHFFIHLNELDIRKLFSMRYIIEQLQAIQFSPEEFESYWGPSLARISFLIQKVSSINNEIRELAMKIESEVYKSEALSPYWQRKLNILVSLGVLQ